MRRLVKRNVLALLEQMYSAAGGGMPEMGNVSEGEEGTGAAPAVPGVVLKLMKLQARIKRLWRRT
jgi:hypothetical protein